MQDLTCEAFVDDGYAFAGGSVRVIEYPSVPQPDTQRVEVAGGDVDLACHVVLTGLFAILDHDAAVQTPFIGQA